MSALTFPALGLANRAAQALPALFADLAMRSPPADVACLDSTGYHANGIGAGRYISDHLCDAALLAAHPRFVFATANGRIFRLLPEAGSISAEQAGAAGDGESNDQPIIQAAIDYAAAVGAAELRFEAPRYRIHATLRTSPAELTRADDGHPLVIRRSITLRGCTAEKVVLDFRGLDGADPEDDYQLVATNASDPALAVWRGGGIFLQGDTIDPGAGRRSIGRLQLERLVLQGNRQHTGEYVWPADPLTGRGWDHTDRALWSQDCYIGEIVCRDVDMFGWKGEIFHIAGEPNGCERVELQRCHFATSNASALNPGTLCEVLAHDCKFGDCFQAQEDVSKTRATYRNCTWYSCDTMQLGCGACDGIYYTDTYPTRDEAEALPMTLLDNCEFRDMRTLRFASWVRGSIRLVDTTLYFSGSETQALRDIDLTVESWLDRKGEIWSLEFNGIDSLTETVWNAPAGVHKQPPTHVRLRMSHHRTRAAADAGRHWLGGFYRGYIDPSCEIVMTGECAGGGVMDGGAAPVAMPLIRYEGFRPSRSYWPKGWDHMAPITGSGEIVPSAPLTTLRMEGGIIADMTLARMPAGGAAFGYAEGQRIRFTKQGDDGAIRFIKGASPSFVVAETRVLDLEYDWIEFSYNRERQRWEEEGFLSAA